MPMPNLILILGIYAVLVLTADMPVGGATIRYFNITEDITGARKYCAQYNGHLLTIKNQEKLDILQDLFYQGDFGDGSPTNSILLGDAWIDLYNTGTISSSYEWVSDGDSLGSFNDWLTSDGEPDNEDTEKCVRVVFGSNPWKWRTMICSRQYNFVCEIPSDESSSMVPTSHENAETSVQSTAMREVTSTTEESQTTKSPALELKSTNVTFTELLELTTPSSLKTTPSGHNEWGADNQDTTSSNASSFGTDFSKATLSGDSLTESASTARTVDTNTSAVTEKTYTESMENATINKIPYEYDIETEETTAGENDDATTPSAEAITTVSTELMVPTGDAIHTTPSTKLTPLRVASTRLCRSRCVNLYTQPKSHKEIRKELEVDKTLLTRFRMKKISVDDRRVSVQVIGCVVIVAMVTLFLLLVCPDIRKVFQNARGVF